MARVKLDENLPRGAAEILQEQGHDAMTVGDQGMSGDDDATLGAACQQEGRTIVTLDRGFGDPRRHPTHGTPGIIVLRPTAQDATAVMDLVRVVSELLNSRSPANALWILDATRLRIRGPDEA